MKSLLVFRLKDQFEQREPLPASGGRQSMKNGPGNGSVLRVLTRNRWSFRPPTITRRTWAVASRYPKIPGSKSSSSQTNRTLMRSPATDSIRPVYSTQHKTNLSSTKRFERIHPRMRICGRHSSTKIILKYREPPSRLHLARNARRLPLRYHGLSNGHCVRIIISSLALLMSQHRRTKTRMSL